MSGPGQLTPLIEAIYIPCRHESTIRDTFQITITIAIKGFTACQGAIQLPLAAMIYAFNMHSVVWVRGQRAPSIGGR